MKYICIVIILYCISCVQNPFDTTETDTIRICIDYNYGNINTNALYLLGKNIVYTDIMYDILIYRKNSMLDAGVYFIEEKQIAISYNHENVVLHEVMHYLGYTDNNNTNSIMYHTVQPERNASTFKEFINAN